MRGRSQIERGAGTAARVCDGRRVRESLAPRGVTAPARGRGRAPGRLAWFLPCSVRRDLQEVPLGALTLAGHRMVAPREVLLE